MQVDTVAQLVEARRLFGSRSRARREGEGFAFHRRVAVELERPVGAAPQADGCSFEVAGARVEINREHIRQIGRWRDGQRVARLAGVVVTFHHVQLNLLAVLEPVLAVSHQCEFAHGHTVDGGDGQPPYPALEGHVEDWSVDGHDIGVRAVEHHHALAVFGRGVHEVDHRHVIGVESQAHVLEVDCYNINAGHGGRRGHRRFAVVERGDGDAGLLVDAAGHVLAGVGVAAEAVFGREYVDYVDAMA